MWRLTFNSHVKNTCNDHMISIGREVCNTSNNKNSSTLPPLIESVNIKETEWSYMWAKGIDCDCFMI